MSQYLRIFLEQFDWQHDQVVEVDGVVDMQVLLILLIHRFEGFDLPGPVAAAGFYGRENIRGCIEINCIGGYVHLPGDLFQQRNFVGLIVNAEILLKAQVFDVVAQNLYPEGVKSGEGQIRQSFSGEIPYTVGHLPGGLVSEGQRNDRRLGNTFFEHVGNSENNHPGLPGTGTGDDQQRSVEGRGGSILFRVEFPL